MHDYSRIGATARLTEIQSEIAAIRDAFSGVSLRRLNYRPTLVVTTHCAN